MTSILELREGDRIRVMLTSGEAFYVKHLHTGDSGIFTAELGQEGSGLYFPFASIDYITKY